MAQIGDALSLNELFSMTAHIYRDQNSARSREATFAHFVEACGMLTIADRKKKPQKVDITDALCKTLGWYFPLLAKMGVENVEALVFRKFPNVCPYCLQSPHEDIKCKLHRGESAMLNHKEITRISDREWANRPTDLDGWQDMFNRIYPRSADEGGRSTIGLLEELGEMAEAIRVFDAHPQYFLGEAADAFSYIMGLANEHAMREAREGRSFSFGREFLIRYPGRCTQCTAKQCRCPELPEATIGRLAKELQIQKHEQLFITDSAKFDEQGSAAAQRASEIVTGPGQTGNSSDKAG
jgi:hypothetical protein